MQVRAFSSNSNPCAKPQDREFECQRPGPDQGFKLTPIFARVRLKQFLRASPVIPVHAKSAPALLCPQASSQQEDWQGQIVAEFLQKFIAPVRRPVLAEDSVGPRATTVVTMIRIINKKPPSRCANRTLRKAILMHDTENLVDIHWCVHEFHSVQCGYR